MKYHTLFFSKIGKDVANLSSAAVVFGALRVKLIKEAKLYDLAVTTHMCHPSHLDLYLFSRLSG